MTDWIFLPLKFQYPAILCIIAHRVLLDEHKFENFTSNSRIVQEMCPFLANLQKLNNYMYFRASRSIKKQTELLFLFAKTSNSTVTHSHDYRPNWTPLRPITINILK